MRRLAAAAAGVVALAAGAFVANETLFSESTCARTVAVGASWDAAYKAASPGDVLCVEGGTHSSQTFTLDASKTSPDDVVFQPAGAAVTVNGIASGTTSGLNGARHLTIRDVKVAGSLVTRPGSEDLTFERIDSNGLNISGGNGISLLGGDYGPVASGPAHIKQGAQNVLIDGAVFHDFTILDPAKHSECILVWEGARFVTIRNSVFRNCTDFGVLVKPGFDMLFESNFFDVPMPGNTATQTCNPNCPRGGNSLALSEGARITVRSNSMLGGLRIDPEVTGVTNTGNLVNASPSLFADGNARDDGLIDLHLVSGASAIDAGPATCVPTTDIDGQARPQGPRCDNGADEFGAGEEPLPTTTEPLPTTTDPLPTTTEPPPACPTSGSLALSVLSENAATITLGWTAVSNATGYRFSRSDQTKRPHTWDGSRTSVTFGKGAECYGVEALTVSQQGSRR